MVDLPIIVPDIDFDEVEADLRAVFASGQLTSGPYGVDFERAVADFVGADLLEKTHGAIWPSLSCAARASTMPRRGWSRPAGKSATTQ